MTLLDFLPDKQLMDVENLHDFSGMLVFDKWTCVPLLPENERRRFVRDTLRNARIDPVPMKGFAVWVAKVRWMLQ